MIADLAADVSSRAIAAHAPLELHM
jgi:hypothetical protein